MDLLCFEIWTISDPSLRVRDKCIYHADSTIVNNQSISSQESLSVKKMGFLREEKTEETSKGTEIVHPYEKSMALLQRDDCLHRFARSLVIAQKKCSFENPEMENAFLTKAMAHFPPSYLQCNDPIRLRNDAVTQLAYSIFCTRILIKKELLKALAKFKENTKYYDKSLFIRKNLQDPQCTDYAPFRYCEVLETTKHNSSSFSSLLDALTKQMMLPTEEEVIKEICDHLEEYSQGDFIGFSENLFFIKSFTLLYLKVIAKLMQVSLCIYYDKQEIRIETKGAAKTVKIGYETPRGIAPKKQSEEKTSYTIGIGLTPQFFQPTTLTNKFDFPKDEMSSSTSSINSAFYQKAIELRNKMGVDINIDLLMQALTPPETERLNNHSRFAFLGDSYIRYATFIYIYMYPSHLTLQEAQKSILSNQFMIDAAFNRNLVEYMKLPNIIPERDNKVFADTVEAMIGAAYLTRGEVMANQMMAWFDLPCDLTFLKDSLTLELKQPSNNDVILDLSIKQKNEKKVQFLYQHIPDIEKKMNYTFNNKNLLIESMTQPSYRYLGTINYNRLKQLGEAVTRLIITLELYTHYPDASPGQLTGIKQILQSFRHFASWRNDLTFGILDFCPDITQQIEDINSAAILSESREKNKPFTVTLPIESAFIFEELLYARVGAVFVDSGFSLAKATEVYHHLVGAIMPFYNYLLDDNQALYLDRAKLSHNYPEQSAYHAFATHNATKGYC